MNAVILKETKMFIVYTNIRNSMKIPTDHKIILASRMLVIGLIAILVLVVTTGFVWMETDHVMHPLV